MFFKLFSRQIKFSRTFQDSPVYSSTFQACANPECNCMAPNSSEPQDVMLNWALYINSSFLFIWQWQESLKVKGDFSWFLTEMILYNTSRLHI